MAILTFHSETLVKNNFSNNIMFGIYKIKKRNSRFISTVFLLLFECLVDYFGNAFTYLVATTRKYLIG